MVTAPDIHDGRNLRRLLQFINCTITDDICIGADFLHDMDTCIGAAHTIHPNMQGHAGGCIYFGT